MPSSRAQNTVTSNPRPDMATAHLYSDSGPTFLLSDQQKKTSPMDT